MATILTVSGYSPVHYLPLCRLGDIRPPPLTYPRPSLPICTRDKSTSALLSHSNNAAPPRTAPSPAHSRPAAATASTSGGGFVGPSGPKLCDGRRRRGAAYKMTPNGGGGVQTTLGLAWAVVDLATLPAQTNASTEKGILVCWVEFWGVTCGCQPATVNAGVDSDGG